MIITTFYFLYDHIVAFLFRRVSCSMTLDNKDEIFKIVRRYLTEQGYLKGGNMVNLKCTDSDKKLKWWQWRQQLERESKKHKVDFLPGGGSHFFEYKGQRMWVSMVEKETISTGYDLTPSKRENMYIYVQGKDKKYLRELINDAIDFCE